MGDATTPSAALVTAHKELATILLDEFKDPTKPISARRACEMVALAMAVAVMQGREDHARFKSLEQRVDALDATNTALQKSVDLLEQKPSVQDAGVWRSGVAYEAGDIVSRQGGGWICSGAHYSSRDFDHARFRLLVKSGKDARTNGSTREA